MRIFEVELRRGRDRERYPYLYGCSKKVRRPRLITPLSPATTTEVYRLARRGTRILIEVYVYADGGGGSELGWFDTRTGAARTRSLDNIAGADFGQEILSATLGRDGSIAYVRNTSNYPDDDEPEEPPNERALFYVAYDRAKLQRERLVTKGPPVAIDPFTLAYGADELTWRTVGPERSVDLPAERGTTSIRKRRLKSAPGNCSGSVGRSLFSDWLPQDGPGVEIFRIAGGSRKGVYACRNASKRTRGVRIGPARATLAHAAVTQAGLAFLLTGSGAGPGGTVGFLSSKGLLRTRRLTAEPYAPRRYADLLADGGRGVVLVNRAAGGFALSHLAGTANGFAAEQVLTWVPAGEFVPHSVRLAGAVIRFNAVGEPRSAVPAT